jgi:hypothetical protein
MDSEKHSSCDRDRTRTLDLEGKVIEKKKVENNVTHLKKKKIGSSRGRIYTNFQKKSQTLQPPKSFSGCGCHV